jgi:hypothetical protein
MPPLLPAAQVVHTRVTGVYGTTSFTNGFHLKYSGPAPSEVVLNGLCQQIGTHWGATMSGLMNTAAVVQDIFATDLTSDTSAQGTDGTDHPGTHPGTVPLPANIACCITMKTNARWRGGHPRLYLTALDNSETVDRRFWLATFVQLVETQSEAFRTLLNGMTNGGASWQLVCLRRHKTLPTGEHVLVDPPLPLPIIGMACDQRIDTQRRRLGPDVPA